MDSMEQEAAIAVSTSDLPRLQLCLDVRPDLAVRDDACIPFIQSRPLSRMTLLDAAVSQASARVYMPSFGDALSVLDWVAARYRQAHPSAAGMQLQTYDDDEIDVNVYKTTTQTPLDLVHSDRAVVDSRLPSYVPIIDCLLARGLLSPEMEHYQNLYDHSLLFNALWGADKAPPYVARLLEAGFRLRGEQEYAYAITACLRGRRSIRRAKVGLRLLLSVYAGRMTRCLSATTAQEQQAEGHDVVYELALHVRDGRDVLPLIDLLRALGMRLTPYIRGRLTRIDPYLLPRIAEADAARVRRTLMARRALSQLPDDVRDRIASAASEGQPYSRRLINL
jgi:hypothetical protein